MPSLNTIRQLFRTAIAIASCCIALLHAPMLVAKTTAPSESLAPVLKNVLPSVVNISVLGQMPANAVKTKTPAHQNPYQPRPNRKFRSVGSGIIINAHKGMIITNAHVIRNAKVITVTLQDGRSLRAHQIGADPASDIALLHVKAKGLTAIHPANSNHVEVGDFVAAIGNPFGLHHSVTSGMVSALHRNDLRIEGYEDFIQTDAPINPGNSGGALINRQGKLIGMNTAIIGPDGANVGIGFAIPSNMIAAVIPQLIKHGKVERGVIGVIVQKLSPPLAHSMHLNQDRGAIVTEILDHSPAQHAGIELNDVITLAGENPIDGPATLRNAVGLQAVGQPLTITLYRKGHRRELTVKPVAAQAIEKQMKASQHLFDGVQMAAIDERTAQGRAIQGIIAIGVDYTSQAWFAGLRPGDTILTVNNQPVSSIQQLTKMLNHEPKRLLLKVHHGVDRYIVIEADNTKT